MWKYWKVFWYAFLLLIVYIGVMFYTFYGTAVALVHSGYNCLQGKVPLMVELSGATLTFPTMLNPFANRSAYLIGMYKDFAFDCNLIPSIDLPAAPSH